MLRILIISISLFFCYLNFKVYQSYKVQVEPIFEFNKNEYKSNTYYSLQNFDIDFPNLSATSFPMYSLLARYQISFGDYNKALDLLNESSNVNPYLKVKESLKAEIYHLLGVRDSSFYYSKLAFEGLPQNAKHFQQYIKELVYRKDYDEINKIFLNSEAKYNSDYWLNYFSAFVNKKTKHKKTVDSLALLAIEKFPTNNQLKTISAYILYGQDNIKESYELFELGIKDFESANYEGASRNFMKSLELNPTDYTFYENAGMSLINTGEYKKAIEYFEKVLNFKDAPKDGKSFFGIATCHFELGDRDLACSFYRKSRDYGYQPAYQRLAEFCN